MQVLGRARRTSLQDLFEGHYGTWQDGILMNSTETKEKKNGKKKAGFGGGGQPAEDALTNERPITGWVSSLCAGKNSAVIYRQ